MQSIAPKRKCASQPSDGIYLCGVCLYRQCCVHGKHLEEERELAPEGPPNALAQALGVLGDPVGQGLVRTLDLAWTGRVSAHPQLRERSLVCRENTMQRNRWNCGRRNIERVCASNRCTHMARTDITSAVTVVILQLSMFSLRLYKRPVRSMQPRRRLVGVLLVLWAILNVASREGKVLHQCARTETFFKIAPLGAICGTVHNARRASASHRLGLSEPFVLEETVPSAAYVLPLKIDSPKQEEIKMMTTTSIWCDDIMHKM